VRVLPSVCHAASGWNATTLSLLGGAGGTASGNIDPLYGQYFTGVISTANAGYTNINSLLANATATSAAVTANINQSGLTVIPQANGWGGNVNVSLGPQTAANQNGLNVVWVRRHRHSCDCHSRSSHLFT
jgi:hypothetical protein